VVLVVYSAIAEPIYYPRYLCYTSPAAALLLAVCIAALVRSRDRVTAVLAVLALAATPHYLFTQRGPYAKEGMDFSQIADLITERAAPGDCLVLDNTVTWLPGPVRSLTAARPRAYEKLVDPGRGRRAADRNRLWDAHIAIWAVADRVRRCTVLWTVSDRDHMLPDHDAAPYYDAGRPLDPGPRMSRSARVPGGAAARLPHRRALAVQLRPGHPIDAVTPSPSAPGRSTTPGWRCTPPRPSGCTWSRLPAHGRRLHWARTDPIAPSRTDRPAGETTGHGRSEH
jgi:hypothetical protein